MTILRNQGDLERFDPYFFEAGNLPPKKYPALCFYWVDRDDDGRFEFYYLDDVLQWAAELKRP
jgi:hypothetical protein